MRKVEVSRLQYTWIHIGKVQSRAVFCCSKIHKNKKDRRDKRERELTREK